MVFLSNSLFDFTSFFLKIARSISERGWPWPVNNFLPVHWWLSLIQSKLKILVAWQVSMVSVVDVFGNSEYKWVGKLVKLVVVELDNILNTIAILVSNSSLPCFLSFGSGSLQSQELEVLWALNVVDIERESSADSRAHLNVFSIRITNIVKWLSNVTQLINVEFNVLNGSQFIV